MSSYRTPSRLIMSIVAALALSAGVLLPGGAQARGTGHRHLGDPEVPGDRGQP